MGRYKKNLEKGTFEYQFYEAMGFPPLSDEGEIPLVVRITLGDMDLLDGFYMSLPENTDSLPIEDAIRKYILCETQEDRVELKKKLSRDPNPDLVDIYDALLKIYEQAEDGEVSISYHINNGDLNIQPSDPVSLHQQFCMTNEKIYGLLDLVLEVYDKSDLFSGMTDEQKNTMLDEFRRIFILYLMDKFDYQPGLSETSPHFSSILEHLTSEGVIYIENEKARYVLTYKGHDLLKNIVREAESYIDNFDIFGDVYAKGHKIEFNTGYGDNLIVPALIHEGINPYRALFLTALYLGNLDELASDLTRLFSEELFRELFNLTALMDTRTELLNRIIHEGKTKIEEQSIRSARLEYAENIRQCIKSF